jgi:hypothetical protein
LVVSVIPDISFIYAIRRLATSHLQIIADVAMWRRFQVSVFRCQENEVIDPDTSYETKFSWSSEPQNIEQEISNDEVWNRCAQSFFKNINDRIPYFAIHYSLFDIRYSLFQSFFFDLTGRFLPAALNSDTRHQKPLFV